MGPSVWDNTSNRPLLLPHKILSDWFVILPFHVASPAANSAVKQPTKQMFGLREVKSALQQVYVGAERLSAHINGEAGPHSGEFPRCAQNPDLLLPWTLFIWSSCSGGSVDRNILSLNTEIRSYHLAINLKCVCPQSYRIVTCLQPVHM